MEKIIKNFIDHYKLSKERSVVLAISGGPDSIVLLDLFIRFFPKEKIVVAHANHGLRVESRWDESFVAALAAEYGLRYFGERLHLKTSAEAEARDARYAFLDRVRSETGSKYEICAHHLNDQAETVLLSLVRGSGPLAVWGMKEQEGTILRPLLAVSKAEILAYAKKRHLRYHLDRTNFNVRFARNRMRAKVIPVLQKLNPLFLEAIGRNSELGREMADAWKQILAKKTKQIDTSAGLDIKKLLMEPIFVQKELIKRKLTDALVRPEGVSSQNVEKVHDLLILSTGKMTEIGGIRIVRGVKYLTFAGKNKKKTPALTPIQKLVLDTPLHFNGRVLKLTKAAGKATKNNVLLPETIGYNLKIRTWRAGDRIKTKSGTKKLQDVFSDAKVPVSERSRWPIVTAGRAIVWVPALAACDLALPVSKKKQIKIEVRNERKKK